MLTASMASRAYVPVAVSRWIETRTDWSIKKFVRAARGYRTVEMQASADTIIVADPLPDDVGDALDRTHRHAGTH